jgi:hypothetical protein
MMELRIVLSSFAVIVIPGPSGKSFREQTKRGVATPHVL